MADPLPLAPEEEATLRADLAASAGTVRGWNTNAARRLLATLDAARSVPAGDGRLVCALCLFVGDSEDPEPVTVMNGHLTCEPHNGYFQGGDHVQALVAWHREHPKEADRD